MIPTFHDGALIGIQLAAGRATLTLVTAEGASFELQLNDLEALHIENFREGNIIFEVELLSGASPSSALLERLFLGPHPSAAAHFHDSHREFLKAKTECIESKDSTVISITSSYGADLVALCGSVTLATLTTNGDQSTMPADGRSGRRP